LKKKKQNLTSQKPPTERQRPKSIHPRRAILVRVRQRADLQRVFLGLCGFLLAVLGSCC
jgi:hypothetical protein